MQSHATQLSVALSISSSAVTAALGYLSSFPDLDNLYTERRRSYAFINLLNSKCPGYEYPDVHGSRPQDRLLHLLYHHLKMIDHTILEHTESSSRFIATLEAAKRAGHIVDSAMAMNAFLAGANDSQIGDPNVKEALSVRSSDVQSTKLVRLAFSEESYLHRMTSNLCVLWPQLPESRRSIRVKHIRHDMEGRKLQDLLTRALTDKFGAGSTAFLKPYAAMRDGYASCLKQGGPISVIDYDVRPFLHAADVLAQLRRFRLSEEDRARLTGKLSEYFTSARSHPLRSGDPINDVWLAAVEESFHSARHISSGSEARGTLQAH